MSALIAIACVLVACAVGIPLSIWATAGMRKNRRAFAIASALFFSFGLYNPIEEKIAEAREDTDHAKRQKAGDPPTPV
jgi:hypothetical protein